MKTIFISILIIISISLFGQKKKAMQDDLYYIPEQKQGTIPKNTNTIIITDTLSQEVYYDKITDILFESGYGILTGDKLQGSITTSDRSFKNGNIKLNFLIKGNKVLLRGDFMFTISIDFGGVSSTPSWSTIKNYGMKKSVAQNAWNEMLKIADQIPGKKEYITK